MLEGGHSDESLAQEDIEYSRNYGGEFLQIRLGLSFPNGLPRLAKLTPHNVNVYENQHKRKLPKWLFRLLDTKLLQSGVNGFFDNKENTIYTKENAPLTTQVHESAHALTSQLNTDLKYLKASDELGSSYKSKAANEGFVYASLIDEGIAYWCGVETGLLLDNLPEHQKLAQQEKQDLFLNKDNFREKLKVLRIKLEEYKSSSRFLGFFKRARLLIEMIKREILLIEMNEIYPAVGYSFVNEAMNYLKAQGYSNQDAIALIINNIPTGLTVFENPSLYAAGLVKKDTATNS